MKMLKSSRVEKLKGPRPFGLVALLLFNLSTLQLFNLSAETVKTASQPWVTNHVAQVVAPLATTNQLAAVAAELPRKADAVETHVFADGATNALRVVRSNVSLVIREIETANGQRQFRLIRREDD